MRRLLTIFVMMLFCFVAKAEQFNTVCVDNSVNVSSPSGSNTIVLDLSGKELRWMALHNDVEVVAPSRLAMITDRGTWGVEYPKAKVELTNGKGYNGAIVKLGDYALEMRAYGEGVAYRFISKCSGEYRFWMRLQSLALRVMIWRGYHIPTTAPMQPRTMLRSMRPRLRIPTYARLLRMSIGVD